MPFKKLMVGTSGFAVLLMLAGDAPAAPLVSAVKEFDRTANENRIEKAQYRLCVTEGGARQCRRVEIYGPGYPAPGPRVYGYQPLPPPVYGYQPPAVMYGGTYPLAGYGYLPAPVYNYTPNYTERYVDPDRYPTGSPAWWDIMDKLGRGGQQD